jgi:hypothetical protein
VLEEVLVPAETEEYEAKWRGTRHRDKQAQLYRCDSEEFPFPTAPTVSYRMGTMTSFPEGKADRT